MKRPEDLVASYTDAAGETEEIVLGPFGTASRVTDAAGRIQETARDTNGKPRVIAYPAGRQFTAEHDRRGRRTSLTDSATGATLALEYDAASGTLTTLDNGRGQQASFEYDAFNRQTAFTGFAGRRTERSVCGDKARFPVHSLSLQAERQLLNTMLSATQRRFARKVWSLRFAIHQLDSGRNDRCRGARFQLSI